VQLAEVPFEEITSEVQLRQVVTQLETQMREAAKKFEFERAAALRDRIRALKQRDLDALFAPSLLAAELAEPTDATPPANSSDVEVPAGPTPKPARGGGRREKG